MTGNRNTNLCVLGSKHKSSATLLFWEFIKSALNMQHLIIFLLLSDCRLPASPLQNISRTTSCCCFPEGEKKKSFPKHKMVRNKCSNPDWSKETSVTHTWRSTRLVILTWEWVWDFLKMSHRPMIRKGGKKMEVRHIYVKDTIQWCVPPTPTFTDKSSRLRQWNLDFHKTHLKKNYWRGKKNLFCSDLGWWHHKRHVKLAHQMRFGGITAGEWLQRWSKLLLFLQCEANLN